MCDTPWIKCSGCWESLPVHIADYCIPRSDIEVRCNDCPPIPVLGWIAFTKCISSEYAKSISRKSDIEVATFEDLETLGDVWFDYEDPSELGTIYMRVIGQSMLNGYRAGGGISPNCSYSAEIDFYLLMATQTSTLIIL